MRPGYEALYTRPTVKPCDGGRDEEKPQISKSRRAVDCETTLSLNLSLELCNARAGTATVGGSLKPQTEREERNAQLLTVAAIVKLGATPDCWDARRPGIGCT